MTSVIIPTNNKGGVGKTSLTTDLASMLALRREVGFIDADRQATLYGTLTDSHESMFLAPDQYLTHPGAITVLQQSATFRFAQGQKKIVIDIPELSARASLFPFGLMTDRPEAAAEKLDDIVRTMAEAEVIAMDLPPIAHARTDLSQTVTPLLDRLGGRVDLFPLIVTTPNQVNIDIGLKGYRDIERYLIDNGVAQNRIHPVVIINKVPINRGEQERSYFGAMDDGARVRLAEHKIIFDACPTNYYEFKDRFKHDGRMFRVMWMPDLPDLSSNAYALLKGNKPELHTLPQLFNQVVDAGFPQVHQEINELQWVYCQQMAKLCSYVEAHTQGSGSARYRVHKHVREVRDLQTELGRRIYAGVQDVYQMWDEGLSEDYVGQDLRIRHHPNNQLSIQLSETNMPLEVLAQGIFGAEQELGVTREWPEDAAPSCPEDILRDLHSERYYNPFIRAEKETYAKGMVRFDLSLDSGRVNPTLSATEYDTRINQFDTFLRHLDRAIHRAC